MSARAADIELRLRRRKLRADKRAAERELKSGGKDLAKTLRSGFTTGLGQLSAFGTLSGLAEVGRDALNFEETLTRIGIQAKGTANLDQLRFAAKSTAKELGLSSSDVLKAANEIVNLQGAAGLTTQKMTTLSRASVATGAELSALAGVGFALDNAFKLSNPEEFEGALSAVIEAGKQGSVPLGQMTVVLQQVATQWARVGASGKQGAAELAAAIQVARKGFGSAAEVGTGLNAFINQLDQNAAKLRDSFNVEVFQTVNGEQQLRPILEILDEIAASPLVKDNSKLVEGFGSANARQFLRILMANRDEYEKLTNAAVRSNAVQEDSAMFLNSNAGRMQRALASVRSEVAELFTPDRLEKWTRAMELAGTAVGFVVDNLEHLLIGFTALRGARAAFSFIKMRDAAAQLADKTASAGNGIGAVVKRAKGLGGKAKAIAGIGAALGTAAVAGWELGRALDNALGLSDSLAGIKQVSESREQFARKLRRQVEASDEFLKGISGQQFLGRNVGDIADRVRAGRAVSKEDLEFLRSVAPVKVLTAGERAASLGEAQDIEGEAKAAAARARNARAANTFAQSQQTIASRLFRTEFVRGDKEITQDEVRKALEQAGAIAMATPVTTRGLTDEERSREQELNRVRAETQNRERLDRLIELLEELNRQSGGKVTLKMDGQTLATTIQNNTQQHRDVTR